MIRSKILLVLLFCTILIKADTIIKPSGALNVNQGRLNYTLPLKLPVGVGGFQPRINLIYNQNGSANSYYGKG